MGSPCSRNFFFSSFSFEITWKHKTVRSLLDSNAPRTHTHLPEGCGLLLLRCLPLLPPTHAGRTRVQHVTWSRLLQDAQCNQSGAILLVAPRLILLVVPQLTLLPVPRLTLLPVSLFNPLTGLLLLEPLWSSGAPPATTTLVDL